MQNYDLSFLLANESDASATKSSLALSPSVHIHCSPQHTPTTIQTDKTSTIIDLDEYTPDTPSTPIAPLSPVTPAFSG